MLASRPAASSQARLEDQPLLRGVDRTALDELIAAVEPRTLAPGELVVHEGDRADAVYFVSTGAVRVELASSDGSTKQVAVFGPGVSFGEAALLDERVRSADVRAEVQSEVGVLTLTRLDEIESRHPGLHARLFQNLAQMLAQRLAGANAQLRALDS